MLSPDPPGDVADKFELLALDGGAELFSAAVEANPHWQDTARRSSGTTAAGCPIRRMTASSASTIGFLVDTNNDPKISARYVTS